MRNQLLICMCFALALISCKNTSNVPAIDVSNSSGLRSQEELESLKAERNRLISELTSEKLANDEEMGILLTEKERLAGEKEKIEDEIVMLEVQLNEANSSEQATEEELIELQKAHELALETRDTLLLKIAANEIEIKQLQAQIVALNEELAKKDVRISELEAEIDSLKDQLEEEKSKNKPETTADASEETPSAG